MMNWRTYFEGFREVNVTFYLAVEYSTGPEMARDPAASWDRRVNNGLAQYLDTLLLHASKRSSALAP